MPKLNVQQNNQNVIKAFQVALETSHDNLLDNAYFVGGGSQLGDGVFPINQRGQTAYTGANAHTFDRWKQQYNTNTQLLSNGIRVYGDWDINQTVLENLPTGEPYTLSVKYSNLSGTDGLHLFAYNSSLQTITEVWTHDASGIFACTFTPQTQIKTIALGYRGSGDGDVVIQAVKLEKGTVSTLANDVPPDFGEELAKCQRDLFIRDYAQNDVIANGLTNNLTMFLPVSMRSGGSPQMTFTVTPYVIGNGVISTPTSVNLASVNGNQVQIYAPTTESHNAQAIVLYASSATRMTISNEL